MAKVTKELAAQYAAQIEGGDWEAVRDELDIETGGELDAIQLNLLTDWVCEARWPVESASAEG